MQFSEIQKDVIEMRIVRFSIAMSTLGAEAFRSSWKSPDLSRKIEGPLLPGYAKCANISLTSLLRVCKKNKFCGVTIQMKPLWQTFHMVLFVLQYFIKQNLEFFGIFYLATFESARVNCKKKKKKWHSAKVLHITSVHLIQYNRKLL